jgi:hypothetical protein
MVFILSFAVQGLIIPLYDWQLCSDERVTFLGASGKAHLFPVRIQFVGWDIILTCFLC